MSDNELWSDDEGNDGQVVALSSSSELSNQQIAHNMAQQERSIMYMTDNLATQLMKLEEIVVAAHKVADFTPNATNDEQKAFWHDKIIPTLIDSLRQDIKARVIIVDCFSAIRDLTIVIQNNYNIVQRSKGSEMAIQIAQESLPEALENLNDAIVKAKSLTTNALEKFDEYAPKIYNIIGPEAAKNVEEKVKYEEDINNRICRQQQHLTQLNNLQGDINRYIYMIQAIDKQLAHAGADVEESKQRMAEMNKQSDDINRKMNETIANVPPTVKEDIQKRNKSGWWIFSQETVTTETVTVKNPQREAEKRYYENIAKAETQRIKDNCKDEEQKQKAMKEYREKLECDRSTYEGQLNTASDNFNKQSGKLNELLQYEQGEIEGLRVKIKELNERERETINKIGLMGDPLIQCLTNVRTFAKSIQKGASAFEPLVSILNAVKVMLQDDIRLLKSKEHADILLAGELMMRKVQFLSKYNLDAYKAIQSSMEYKQLGMDKNSRLAIEGTA